MAGEIGDRKQQIAQFFFELRKVGAPRATISFASSAIFSTTFGAGSGSNPTLAARF